MLLINSIKVLFSNLGTMWKVLLYKFVILLIFIGIFAGIVIPQIYSLLSSIRSTGLLTNFENVFRSILRPEMNDNIVLFNDSLNDVLAVIANSDVSFIPVYISIGLIYCVYRFWSSMIDLPISISIEANLTSCAKLPLLSTYIKNFKKSAAYSAYALLIMLPFDILLLMAIFGLSQLFLNWFGLIGLFFIAVFIVVLFSFKSSVFSLWKAAIVVDENKTMPSFKHSISVVFKNFWLMYSYYIVIYLGLILLNLIVAFFTCSAGLILSLPASIMIIAIFQMIFYFSYRRKKYYTDGDTIIAGRLDHTMPDLEPVNDTETEIDE